MGTVLLAPLLGAVALGVVLERARKPWATALLCLAAAGLLLLYGEFTRFDHGQGEALYVGGQIIAPLLVIFGGAAWGTSRLFGWPDLGKRPGRLAGLGLAVCAGVLAGIRFHERDVRASEAIVSALSPSTAEAEALPLSRMGWLDPPRIQRVSLPGPRRALGFAVGGGRMRVLDLESRLWSWQPLQAVSPTPAHGEPRSPEPAR